MVCPIVDNCLCDWVGYGFACPVVAHWQYIIGVQGHMILLDAIVLKLSHLSRSCVKSRLHMAQLLS